MQRETVHNVIAGLTPDTAAEYLEGAGIDGKYALRLLYWVYRRKISSFIEMEDIPMAVRRKLEATSITGLSDPVHSASSSDGSEKYLFSTHDDLLHEAVYLPDGRRRTVCVSVQAGCRMGCRFCATGSGGWRGDLTAGEIVNQVLSIPHPVTNVVMMGMGEAGDNIDRVINACGILTAEWGLAIGHSRVTVSTVGILPSLSRLLDETRCNVTLSLHSPFPEERAEVIPAERKWPFKQALAMMTSARRERKRRFSVAYVMMKGVNDSERHLLALADLIRGTGINVNLLPYHSTGEGTQPPSDRETMMHFKHRLVTSGIEASVRESRGYDINAACGMLEAGHRKSGNIIK